MGNVDSVKTGRVLAVCVMSGCASELLQEYRWAAQGAPKVTPSQAQNGKESDLPQVKLTPAAPPRVRFIRPIGTSAIQAIRPSFLYLVGPAPLVIAVCSTASLSPVTHICPLNSNLTAPRVSPNPVMAML